MHDSQLCLTPNIDVWIWSFKTSKISKCYHHLYLSQLLLKKLTTLEFLKPHNIFFYFLIPRQLPANRYLPSSLKRQIIVMAAVKQFFEGRYFFLHEDLFTGGFERVTLRTSDEGDNIDN